MTIIIKKNIIFSPFLERFIKYAEKGDFKERKISSQPI